MGVLYTGRDTAFKYFTGYMSFGLHVYRNWSEQPRASAYGVNTTCTSKILFRDTKSIKRAIQKNLEMAFPPISCKIKTQQGIKANYRSQKFSAILQEQWVIFIKLYSFMSICYV